jgi:pimeloyl-ACP methyl ester carboxylesterase
MPRPLPLAAVSLVALLLPARLAAQTSPDPRGTYVFESRSTRGDPFEGTVHLYGEPGRILGFVYTAIDPPIAVTGVRWLGRDTLGVRFLLGTTVVTQLFAFDGDRFSGHYRFTRDGVARQIPLTGRRHPATARPDLVPTPCEVAGVPFTARCAMLHVPEDPDAPDGRWIPLRIVILPAEAEPKAPDAMFTFAGGPGQAATEVAGAYAQTMAGVRRTRDVVIVDQRGTGASNPLRCEFEDPQDRTQLLLTWQFPAGELERCRDELMQHADLRLYYSWIAAGDVDRVRDWLGYPEIDLYGGSYGTRMAQTYLARFPERARTVTLRAVEPPGGILPLDNPRDAQAALELVFEECRADADCASAFRDLPGDLAAVAGALEETPGAVRVRDPVTGDSVSITVTPSVFAGGLRRLLMDGEAIPSVPFAVHAAAAGDFSGLAPGIAATLGVSRALYIGMALSVGCPEDAARLSAADLDGATAGTFMGAGPARGFLDACSRWPSATVPEAFYEPVTADVPVLLLSGRYDPTTPSSGAQRVADGLPKAYHLVMPGISHSPFPPCAQDMMTRLVETGGIEGMENLCAGVLERASFVTRRDRLGTSNPGNSQ